MLSMLLIGVATALLLCAITARVIAGNPKKANKSEQGEVLKQLLALSNGENKISGAAPAARLRPPSNQRTLPGNRPRKTTTRIVQPLRTQ